LANNSICCEGNMEGLNALIEAFKQMPQLVSLNLAGNNLTDRGLDMSGVIALAAALKDSQVVNLNLNGNHLKAQGAEELAKALPCCKALASLSLNNNQLCGLDEDGKGIYTIEGITALCQGIKQSKISTLSLADNALCDDGNMEGLNALIKAFKEMPNLSSLNLLGNNVKKASKSALLAARPGLKLEV